MFTHLHQQGPFSEPHARVYTAEITLALEHLHKVRKPLHNLIHGYLYLLFHCCPPAGDCVS